MTTVGGDLRNSGTNGGALEASDSLAGPWQQVATATPFVVTANAALKSYRVKR